MLIYWLIETCATFPFLVVLNYADRGSDIYSSLGWHSNCISAGLSMRVDLKETGVSVNVFKTSLGVEFWILVKNLMPNQPLMGESNSWWSGQSWREGMPELLGEIADGPRLE